MASSKPPSTVNVKTVRAQIAAHSAPKKRKRDSNEDEFKPSGSAAQNSGQGPEKKKRGRKPGQKNGEGVAAKKEQ